MKKYRVWSKEIWVQAIDIEACSSKEAQEKVLNGEGECQEELFEYCETLPSDYIEERQ